MYLKNLVTRIKIFDVGLFLFSLAIIHGVSFHVMTLTDASELKDCVTYLGLAEFDFDQYVVRKYRIIIPFMASALHAILGDLFQILSPWSFTGDFPMGMSFLIVNNLFMALAGVVIFKYIHAHTRNTFSSLIGLLSVLTCRWTGFVAGLPLVDTFYLLVLALVLLGLKTNNKKLLIAAIFLGPWSKEAFIFIAPIIFFFAPVKKGHQIIYFIASGILVFSSRFLIDLYSGTSPMSAIHEDFSHFGNILISLQRLFSFHGVYELFSVTGFWILLLIPALIKKSLVQHLKSFQAFEWWFMASVMLQVLISADIARMLFLFTPVLAVLWARIVSWFVQGDIGLIGARG